MSRIALLAGATGLVGGHLLDRLLAEPAYAQIKVLTRRPLPRSDARVVEIRTDYSDLAARAAELRADDVYCCLGTTLKTAGSKAAFEKVDYTYVVDLARAAKQAGAGQFLVVSAAGTSEKSPSFYSQVKARMERDVSAVGFTTVHILRPSLLMGARSEHRPGERAAQILSPLLSPLLIGSLKKYRPIQGDDVAAAMVRLALLEQQGVRVHHLPLE